MQSLSQLLKGIFDTGQYNDLSAISQRLSELPTLESSAPTIMTLTALAKDTACQSNLYQKLSDILETMDTLASDATSGGNLQMSSNDIQLIAQIFHYLDNSFDISAPVSDVELYAKFNSLAANKRQYNIGTINGQPVLIQFTSNKFGAPILALYVGINGNLGYTDLVTPYITRVTAVDATNYSIKHTNEGVQVGDDVYTNLDSIIITVEDGMASNQMINDILSVALFDGTARYDKVANIVSQYGSASASDYFRDAMSTLDAGSSISILALVSGYFGFVKGDYVEGNDYYTPLKDVPYNTDVIGTVLAILGAAIAVILSTIFKCLSSVLAIVTSILGWLINQSDRLFATTESKIIADAPVILPTFNKPFLTDLNYAPNDEELSLIGEYGVSCSYDPSEPTLQRYAAKSSASTHFVQWLVSAWRRVPTNRGWGMMSWDSSGNILSYTVSGKLATAWSEELDMNELWVTQDDAELRRSITQCILHVWWRKAYKKITDDTTPDTLLHFRSEDYSYLLNHTIVENIAYLAQNFSLTEDRAATIALLAVYASHNAGPSGNLSLDLTLSWDEINAQLPGTMTEFKKTGNMIAVPGPSGLNPSVEWPTVSRSSLITAITLSAITAGIAVAATHTLSRRIKSRAVARIAQRESEFASAQQAYLDDPTMANGLILERANRRLSRAWTKAGKTGVACYNGFNTASTGLATSDNALIGSSLIQRMSGSQSSNRALIELRRLIAG